MAFRRVCTLLRRLSQRVEKAPPATRVGDALKTEIVRFNGDQWGNGTTQEHVARRRRPLSTHVADLGIEVDGSVYVVMSDEPLTTDRKRTLLTPPYRAEGANQVDVVDMACGPGKPTLLVSASGVGRNPGLQSFMLGAGVLLKADGKDGKRLPYLTGRLVQDAQRACYLGSSASKLTRIEGAVRIARLGERGFVGAKLGSRRFAFLPMSVVAETGAAPQLGETAWQEVVPDLPASILDFEPVINNPSAVLVALANGAIGLVDMRVIHRGVIDVLAIKGDLPGLRARGTIKDGVTVVEAMQPTADFPVGATYLPAAELVETLGREFSAYAA
ncbi:MAG: hypothetical protein U1A28_00895 [Patescibacteria group bacterium]|nr:hypothetical protein [Patescibacteria group bacterium]